MSFSKKSVKFVSLSTQTFKILFFAFLSLFFFAGGVFNFILMLGFISLDNKARDWSYLIFFTVLYIILALLSIYKTVKTIKQLKKITTEPVPQSSASQKLLRVVCSWPVIILSAGLTLLVGYIGIAILFILAFQNQYFLYRGFISYIEYFGIMQIVSIVILGLAFMTIMMIMKRLKLKTK